MKQLLVTILFLSGLINSNEVSNKLSKEGLMKLCRHAAEYHDKDETKTTLDQLTQLSKEDFNIAMKYTEPGNKTTMIGYASYFGNVKILLKILELNTKFNSIDSTLKLLFEIPSSYSIPYDLIWERGCKAGSTQCASEQMVVLGQMQNYKDMFKHSRKLRKLDPNEMKELFELGKYVAEKNEGIERYLCSLQYKGCSQCNINPKKVLTSPLIFDCVERTSDEVKTILNYSETTKPFIGYKIAHFIGHYGNLDFLKGLLKFYKKSTDTTSSLSIDRFFRERTACSKPPCNKDNSSSVVLVSFNKCTPSKKERNRDAETKCNKDIKQFFVDNMVPSYNEEAISNLSKITMNRESAHRFDRCHLTVDFQSTKRKCLEEGCVLKFTRKDGCAKSECIRYESLNDTAIKNYSITFNCKDFADIYLKVAGKIIQPY